MSLQTTFQLNTIRCIAQNEGSGSEPYVWPFLCTAATNPGSFDTFPTVAILADSRKVIASSMKAGASAQLEFPGNVVVHSFGDAQYDCAALLVVALIEADDNRVVSMQAGYQAYIAELASQMGHKFVPMKNATDEERDVMIGEIKKAVEKKAYDAVANTLSDWEKTKIFVGAMDADDFLAVGYALYENIENAPPSAPFTLSLVGGGNQFEIDGTMSVVSLEPNPCQAQVDGVTAAEQAIASLRRRIQMLQARLATATPQQKPAIVKAIEQIRAEDMPEADRALQRAEQALRRCEKFGGLDDDIVIDQPGVTPIVG